jgi:hypothetical protein
MADHDELLAIVRDLAGYDFGDDFASKQRGMAHLADLVRRANVAVAGSATPREDDHPYGRPGSSGNPWQPTHGVRNGTPESP